jgi:hypothetical protein
MSAISSSSKSAIVLLVPCLILAVACGTNSPTSPSATPTTRSALADRTGATTNAEAHAGTGAPNSRTGAALAPPTQEAPLNGATDQPTTVTVRWHPVNSSTNPIYNVQISRDGAFSSLVANARITDGNIGYTVFNLANGTRYFWRVSLSVGSNTAPGRRYGPSKQHPVTIPAFRCCSLRRTAPPAFPAAPR